MTKTPGNKSLFEKEESAENILDNSQNGVRSGNSSSCEYLGEWFPSGTHITFNGKDYVCSNGKWIPA